MEQKTSVVEVVDLACNEADAVTESPDVSFLHAYLAEEEEELDVTSERSIRELLDGELDDLGVGRGEPFHELPVERHVGFYALRGGLVEPLCFGKADSGCNGGAVRLEERLESRAASLCKRHNAVEKVPRGCVVFGCLTWEDNWLNHQETVAGSGVDEVPGGGTQVFLACKLVKLS